MTKKWALTIESNIQGGKRVLERWLFTGYPLFMVENAHTVYTVRYS